MIVVSVSEHIGTLSCHDTDNYATIKNISCNLIDQAGLLSSMTSEPLHSHPVQSGLANMSWDEFCGSVISFGEAKATNPKPYPYGPCMGIVSKPTLQGGATPKSPIHNHHKLHPGAQLRRGHPTHGKYYATGSLGSINLQAQAIVKNNQNVDWHVTEYELVIMK